MPLAQLGTLVLLNVAGMATPGPDLLLLTRMATRSRRHALASVSGISTGLVLWVSLTVFGAAALLISYPVLESVIKLVGGVWLVWMGRGMILAARAQFRDRMNVDIDAFVDLEAAEAIIMNAKTQRVGVCNAAETLLVHADVAERFLVAAVTRLTGDGNRTSCD